MEKHIYRAYATIWISVSVAVIVGIVKTKNALCLLAFLIPMSMGAIVGEDEYEDDS